MAELKLKRNLKKSLKDFLTQALSDDNWDSPIIPVEFTTKKGKLTAFPVILINIADKDNQLEEIGSGKYIKYPTVTLRIYAKDGGLRDDLSDWLIEKLEGDIPYYTYVLEDGEKTPTLAGNIIVRKILRDEDELVNTNPELLEEEDRYRHIIQFSCYVAI